MSHTLFVGGLQCRLERWLPLLGLLAPLSAVAGPQVLLLRWPGSEIEEDDRKLQKTVNRALDADDATFASFDVMLMGEDLRTARMDLIERLRREPSACEPRIRPQQTESMAAYAAEQGPFYLALPVNDSIKELVIWRWSDETGALVRVAEECAD